MLFTPLHRLLGEAPGPLTDSMLDSAIKAKLEETDDLDWKSELPPLKGLPQTDFPKDVAAMANRGGGVLIYGVTEKQKKATSRVDMGEEINEGYLRALRSAAVTAVSPPVFGLSTYLLGEEGNRALVVVIPDSTEVPHLIYKGEYFGAPVRNDADTVWMKEGEVERAYRARFEASRSSAEALDRMYAEAITGRDTFDRAWFVAVARPRLPILARKPDKVQGGLVFTDADIHLFKYATSGAIHPLTNVDRYNLRTGLRRWNAPTAAWGTNRWKEAWASAHHDGSVSIIAALGAHPVQRDGNHPGGTVEGIDLEAAVADFMGLIRSAAEHSGADEYEVKVGIEYSNPSDPLVILTVDNQGFPFSETTMKFIPVLATVNAAADDDDFHRQAFELAEDCLNQGGVTRLRLIKAVPVAPPIGAPSAVPEGA